VATEPIEPADLCPACGYRDVTTADGWCVECSSERAIEAYGEKDRERAEARHSRWKGRTAAPSDQPLALVMRQRRHRLEVATRPKEFPGALSDPLELGVDALAHLRAVRNGLGSNSRARSHLAQAEELIKQLAHGPEE